MWQPTGRERAAHDPPDTVTHPRRSPLARTACEMLHKVGLLLGDRRALEPRQPEPLSARRSRSGRLRRVGGGSRPRRGGEGGCRGNGAGGGRVAGGRRGRRVSGSRCGTGLGRRGVRGCRCGRRWDVGRRSLRRCVGDGRRLTGRDGRGCGVGARRLGDRRSGCGGGGKGPGRTPDRQDPGAVAGDGDQNNATQQGIQPPSGGRR
jgi:hypothetical protein